MSILEKVSEWRAKAKAGTLTHEEMKEAIAYLRAGRSAASAGNDAKRAASGAKKPIKSSDDLLKELQGL